MLITIPDVLTAAQVAEARRKLDTAQWVDGRVTAGHQLVPHVLVAFLASARHGGRFLIRTGTPGAGNAGGDATC